MNVSENRGENSSWKIHTLAGVKKKFWLYVLVCVLIVVVWTGLSLPTVFFSLSTSEISSNTSDANDSDSDFMCSAPLQYATTNGICLTEFANILTFYNCPLHGNVLVVRNEEATATELINIFKYLGASAECISKASPFLCLLRFGLCGGSEVSIQPTTSECEEIRDALCLQQWMDVQRLGIVLPDCSMFPAEALSCSSLNDSLSTNVTDLIEKHRNGTTVADLECSEGFYKENGSSICTPSCSTWMQSSYGVTIFRDVVNFIFSFLGFLAAVVVTVISCLARKRMLIFPAVFIVYMSIDNLAVSIVLMVGFMGHESLFCSSRSLIESRMEVTPFCVISGIVLTYAYCQMSLWWLFHTATLFWHVMFPFRAQTFEATGKNKYIHITCIIVGIFLPLVPIVTVMADFAVDLHKQNQNSTSQLRNSLFLTGGLGFQPTTYPTSMCLGRISYANWYSFVLMISIIEALGCSLLIIIFWSVHKGHIKRKQMQQGVSNGKLGYQFSFGKAEKKLLFMLCYFVLSTFIYLMDFFLLDRNFEQFLYSLLKYFICEQGGHDPSNPCSRSDIERNGLALFGILTYIFLALFPVVNLLYAVNIQELRQLWTRIHDSCITH